MRNPPKREGNDKVQIIKFGIGLDEEELLIEIWFKNATKQIRRYTKIIIEEAINRGNQSSGIDHNQIKARYFCVKPKNGGSPVKDKKLAKNSVYMKGDCKR